ncbi:thioesterase II family protein [Nonomuraea endophytica]|uniref:thioesterase II family protein n=1 Tax=Nonomuraea endophytica TaxID=714136 RepID=UPI0037C67355
MSIWLDCPMPKATARRRLVCFPHAGGSAVFFRNWGELVPEAEVHTVRYPGRGERIDEDPPSDLLRLARQIAEAVAPLADRPLAFFGHSLGAVVALETARALEARGILLAHLFASGSRNAPSPGLPPYEEEDDATIAGRLVSLGGTDAELARDPLFLELVIPYVRADTRMYHDYVPEPGPALHCPVTAIAGETDLDLDVRPWQELTTGPFEEHTVAGDHFYLIAEPPCELVRARLSGRQPSHGPR